MPSFYIKGLFKLLYHIKINYCEEVLSRTRYYKRICYFVSYSWTLYGRSKSTAINAYFYKGFSDASFYAC